LTDLERAAWHEAGHTTAAVGLGLRVHAVQIGFQASEFPGWTEAGATIVDLPEIDPDKDLLEAFDNRERQMMMLMAGSIAECIVLGKPRIDRQMVDENFPDWALIFQLLTRAGPVDDHGRRYWRLLEDQTRRLLLARWGTVGRVAKVLLKNGRIEIPG
jgi:hypothetical protein